MYEFDGVLNFDMIKNATKWLFLKQCLSKIIIILIK